MTREFDYNLDGNIRAAFQRRLDFLDKMHSRSQSPKARRRLEAKMVDLRAELADIDAKATCVDLAFERWRRLSEKC